MSEFMISFDPPLPVAVAMDPPLSLDGLNVGVVRSGYAAEHDVLYSIDGRVFAYYPASLLTVLNDIHLEWTLIREKSSHDVTLSGYAVLEAIFQNGGFQFCDPAWPPTPVGDIFDATYLEDKFRAAAAAVWGLVRSLQEPA